MTIEIDELNKSEIEQLKKGDPTLASLLADGHPARRVTRNLFRLDRLANQATSDPVPHTEVDMAEQWWKTADGPIDPGWRDRSRLLQALAEQTLLGADKLDVSDRPSGPIDALVASGTLRNLESDRVAFRHDVFREWAVANVLHADTSWIDRLTLERPAPATLARGIELAARITLERATDGRPWHTLLQRLSCVGAHQTWRRAALLALVRSEIGSTLLERASSELQADDGALLRELIRIVMAVDVIPASIAFAATGIDPALIPANLDVPRGPSWLKLSIWLLALDENVPSRAIPEVVELFTNFSVGTFGATALTPLMTRRLYQWLRKMEPNDEMPPPDESPPFSDRLERAQLHSLKSDLRNGFLMFCKHTPDLAAEYLRALGQSEHNDDTVRSIMKLRGSLALAAPAELAEFTAKVLIEQPRPRGRDPGREREEPFTFLDSEFLPASPAQGPFFELLVSSPKDGLSLVHRLVDHAVAFKSGGRAPGMNIINLALVNGARTFPWIQTYFWSRSGDYYSVTSALMALEAWAHQRVEAGEAFEIVLADVLGPIGSPAAYLLVAVDLLISHWPKSRDAAIGFLSSPELLCLDHTRPVHDSVESPDFFGFGALHTEPRGAVTTAELKRHASRQNTLDTLIDHYSLAASTEQRERLIALLKDSAHRLGPPSDKATLGNPEFMVVHALNLADPANWEEVTVSQNDGVTRTARRYVSPASENRHLQALRESVEDNTNNFAMETSISLATENPSHLSPEARSAAFRWARDVAERAPLEPTDESNSDGSVRMRKEAILTAAMILLRDGDAEQRTEHEEWARYQFECALQSEDDPAHQIRSGIRFNPKAIAYVGMIHALRHRKTREDTRALLDVAARDNPSVAHGYGAAVSILNAVDARLPRAILRCAFVACISPNRKWDLPEEEVAARAELRRRRASAAVDAEVTWLDGEGPEPEWPAFPEEQIRRRRRLRLPGGARDDNHRPQGVPQINEHVNHQAAALWLRQARSLFDVIERPWLRTIAQSYLPWTIAANGAEMDAGDEVDRPPTEWNHAFFALMACCSVGLSFDEVDKLVVTRISTLPDKNYFDVLADYVRSLDAVYFGGDAVSTTFAVQVRTALARRMMSSREWQRLSGTKDMSIEMHIGPAIAVLFFNDHHFVQSTKCYLYPKGIDRLEPFLPILAELVKVGPSPFVVLVMLNLLEVAPRPEHLALLVTAGRTWLDTYPDFRPFWIDHDFGRRLCLLIENIRAQAAHLFGVGQPIRVELDRLLAALVSLGVAEASRVEEALA